MPYRCVLDASAAAALVLSEEDGPAMERVIEAAVTEGERLLVPPLFWDEVGNLLVVAARRGRITGEALLQIVDDLNLLPIVTADESGVEICRSTITLAQTHNLSYYDAVYLELAAREQLPLATFDRELLRTGVAEPAIR
jgi:predicted nucleic acid-binding protein